MYANQQVQLQYAIDREQTPRNRIDIYNPPVRFDLRIAPWMQQYLDWITGMLADMISQRAAGPVSMHFYNNMSKGNWANPDFGREVHNAADFAFMMIGTRQDPNAIPQYVDTYITLRGRFEVSQFPYLRDFIDPADQRGFDDAIAAFQRLVTDVVQFRSGTQQQQQGYNPPSSNGYVPPVSHASHGAPAPAYQGGGYGGPPVGSVGGRSGGGRDYGSTNANNPPPPAQSAPPMQQQAPQVPVQAAPVGSTTLVEVGDMPWNPDLGAPGDSLMPHPLVYNPTRIMMQYNVVNGHTKLNLSKSSMDQIDYSRHMIQSLFGYPPENMSVVKDNGEIITQIKQGADDAVEESKVVDESGARLEEAMGLRSVLSAFTIDEAIMDLRMEMESKVNPEARPMVFHGHAQIFTALIGSKSEYDIIEKLGNCSSYMSLREELKAIGDKSSPRLLTDVSLKLTNLMNSILRERLSIDPSVLEVEDFAHDLEDLYAALKGMGVNGDRLYRAFTADQGRRIKAMFQAPDMDSEEGRKVHDGLLTYRLTTGWEGRTDYPAFTFYGPIINITFLDVLSHDLLVQGLPNLGNVITKQHSAVLFGLAEALFKMENNGLTVDRQLVVTSDGRIIEIYKGALIENTLLMNLVK